MDNYKDNDKDKLKQVTSGVLLELNNLRNSWIQEDKKESTILDSILTPKEFKDDSLTHINSLLRRTRFSQDYAYLSGIYEPHQAITRRFYTNHNVDSLVFSEPKTFSELYHSYNAVCSYLNNIDYNLNRHFVAEQFNISQLDILKAKDFLTKAYIEYIKDVTKKPVSKIIQGYLLLQPNINYVIKTHAQELVLSLYRLQSEKKINRTFKLFYVWYLRIFRKNEQDTIFDIIRKEKDTNATLLVLFWLQEIIKKDNRIF